MANGRRRSWPRRLLLAALWLAAILLLLVAAIFVSLRSTRPPEPRLAGRVERGALVHGGRTRTWFAYVPPAVDAHPAVVLVLHGSMGSGAQARREYGFDFDRLAEQQHFLAVYPQGYDGHWNDARVGGNFAAKREHVDDVGFLHALVDRLVAEHGADRTRVYVTGVSNGGQMTLRLALETPEFARAYAPVVASLPVRENLAITPKNEAVSILFMNGTADPMNPWKGGEVSLYGVWGNRGNVLSADATVLYFRQLARLGDAPVRTQLPDVDPDDGSDAERLDWRAPGHRAVTLVRIDGGGHEVPNPAAYGPRLLGHNNRDFHAADEIWTFFQQAP